MVMFAVLSLVLGTIIGSFLNVLVLRLPKQERANGRSYCPHCHKQLKAAHLVPVLSFLWLRGKCAYCKARISPRYMGVELVTGILFGLWFWWYLPVDGGGLVLLLRAWFISCVAIVVFLIDYDHFLILDRVVVPASVILFCVNIATDVVRGGVGMGLETYTVGGVIAALGAAVVFFALWLFPYKELIGLGDVKFMFFFGQAVLWPGVWIALLLSFYLGAIVAIPLLIFKRKGMASHLPFGTFLSVGMLFAVAFSDKMLAWYMSLLGL